MEPEPLLTNENAKYEYLISLGFSTSEVPRLLHMRQHLQDQPEYCEMIAEQNRLNFARWLVEHNQLGI
ncbi:MAG: hypothetical protein ABI406_01140 [Ktedonobacteraceae bacterium]